MDKIEIKMRTTAITSGSTVWIPGCHVRKWVLTRSIWYDGVRRFPDKGKVFLCSSDDTGCMHIIERSADLHLYLITDIATVHDAMEMVHGPIAAKEAEGLGI